MSSTTTAERKVVEKSGDEYTITYCKEAFRLLEDLTKSFNLSRKDTLGFALSVLRRLKEDGSVSLKQERL